MYKNISFNDYIKYIKNKLNESSTLSKPFIIKKYFPIDHTRTSEYNKLCNLYEQYIEYKFGKFHENYDSYINSLNEGLIMSSPIEKTINIIKKSISNNIEYEIGELNTYDNIGTIDLIMYDSDYQQYAKNFNLILNVCGYYISNTTTDINEYNEKIIYILIEPKYLFDCTEFIYNETDNILYHITLGALYDKIKNNGLIPKAHNKKSTHPDRIYLIQPGNYSQYNFVNIAKDLYKPNNIYRNNIKQYLRNGKLNILVLKIDLNKTTQYTNTIFKDPNLDGGVFVYENIHPKCVDILYDFNI